jgi:adenosylcobinamide amidohydrolase
MSRVTQRFFQTRFRVTGRTLVIDLGRSQQVLSSAPRRGGLVRARYILNHQVPANPVAAPIPLEQCRWGDPARYLGRIAVEVGADRRCVALMTAVPLKNLVTLREEADGLWVEGFWTVGVSNAVRVGELSNLRQTPAPGTINIILVTNARLATSAMVGAVQVATEAKTAAMLAANVRTCTGRPGATGTGTDATVIACGDGPFLRYSGTHTRIGAMIGRLVGQGVRDGLLRRPDSLIPN